MGSGTDALTRTARKVTSLPPWVWPTFSSVAIALSGWAHSVLMNHATRIALLELRDETTAEILREMRTEQKHQMNEVKANREVQLQILGELKSLNRNTTP